MADVKARKLVRSSQAPTSNSNNFYNASSSSAANAARPETAPSPAHRKKPFSSFIKRLTSLKTAATNSYNGPHDSGNSGGRHSSGDSSSRSKRGGRNVLSTRRSGSFVGTTQGSIAFSLPRSNHSFDGIDKLSIADSVPSRLNADGTIAPSNATIGTSNYSYAPSGFSSPTPSERSLTTTLTTIQSTAPGYNPHPNHHHNPNAPPILYNNPLTTPSTANTNGHQNQTYQSATANGLLTDNASVITLASSSKHHRRHSLDTDASVRALAPSSLWGGSRESLPLSVLSANLDRVGGDRASLHSRTLDSSRIFAGEGSVGGASPLASPNRESSGFTLGSNGVANGRSSRRSSAWGELANDGEDDRSVRSVRSGIGSIKDSLRSARSGAVMGADRSPSEVDGTAYGDTETSSMSALIHAAPDQGGTPSRIKLERNGNAV